MDDLGFAMAASPVILSESAALLQNMGMRPTPTLDGYVALDVDVSVHDNSQTKKKGVECTYMGIDGYAPIYAYLGEEGYLCNVELRPGSQHCQKETVEFLADTLRCVRMITPELLLARMDSGNDALDNIKLFDREHVDYLIKRNLRGESIDKWLETAKKHGEAVEPRFGKVVYTGSVYRKRSLAEPVRLVFQVTVRTMQADGQMFDPAGCVKLQRRDVARLRAKTVMKRL